MKTTLASLGLALLAASAPALAQEARAPAETAGSGAAATAAAGAAPTLSQILAVIEGEDRFGRIESVDWDDDGYWEVDYRRNDGARIEIEIDAATGQARAD